MEHYERRMLAVSMAGHDRGKVYMIWKEENDFVFLVDGEQRPLAKPKKKNRRHMQVVKKIPDEWKNLPLQSITDEKIKHVLKCYNKEKEL